MQTQQQQDISKYFVDNVNNKIPGEVEYENLAVNENPSKFQKLPKSGPSSSFIAPKTTGEPIPVVQEQPQFSSSTQNNPFKNEIEENIRVQDNDEKNDNKKILDKKPEIFPDDNKNNNMEEKIKLQNKLKELKLKYARMKKIANINYKIAQEQNTEMKEKINS